MSKEKDIKEIEIEQEDNIEEKQEKEYDFSIRNEIFDCFRELKDNEAELKNHIIQYIHNLFAKNSLAEKYKLLFLYDESSSISKSHSNKIYETLEEDTQDKDILLIIHSGGGEIEPAYLLSKSCKKLCKSKFIVAIPRKAKSAATLISLGADEIHMGLMSELGPIDPQIGNFPALSISNALEKIAQLSEEFPKSSNMFAQYLTENLNLNHLGYFERINESATQYAERLLKGKSFVKGQDEEKLADHFTNHYKDHSFVIDADEALTLLGDEVIKEQTNEYKFSNEVYKVLDLFSVLFRIIEKKDLSVIGNIEDGIKFKDSDDN